MSVEDNSITGSLQKEDYIIKNLEKKINKTTKTFRVTCSNWVAYSRNPLPLQKKKKKKSPSTRANWRLNMIDWCTLRKILLWSLNSVGKHAMTLISYACSGLRTGGTELPSLCSSLSNGYKQDSRSLEQHQALGSFREINREVCGSSWEILDSMLGNFQDFLIL